MAGNKSFPVSSEISRSNPQDSYELIQKIGSGTYGDVYKVNEPTMDYKGNSEVYPATSRQHIPHECLEVVETMFKIYSLSGWLLSFRMICSGYLSLDWIPYCLPIELGLLRRDSNILTVQ